VSDEDAWEPAVEAIDAIFDDDYDRAEQALLASLGQVRKERAEQIKQEAR
jgi:hypothetical protein